MCCDTAERHVSVLFSEPKIPQSGSAALRMPEAQGFSALQRAENSSMTATGVIARVRVTFQCSSASRKFLNCGASTGYVSISVSVSVLFSEPKIPQFVSVPDALPAFGRFQCSSASRKFLNHPLAVARRGEGSVSVLFSEPKIPQSIRLSPHAGRM